MISALFSVLLLTSDAVTAMPAPPPAATVEAPQAERQICKREPIPGSQYGSKRICKTAAEWKAYNQQEVEQVNDHRSHAH